MHDRRAPVCITGNRCVSSSHDVRRNNVPYRNCSSVHGSGRSSGLVGDQWTTGSRLGRVPYSLLRRHPNPCIRSASFSNGPCHSYGLSAGYTREHAHAYYRRGWMARHRNRRGLLPVCTTRWGAGLRRSSIVKPASPTQPTSTSPRGVRIPPISFEFRFSRFKFEREALAQLET